MKLDEAIKAYLNAMNEKHLAGDKSKETAIDADIKAETADFLKLRQEQSRGLSKKMKAKKTAGAGGASNYTIKNNSGVSLKIITDSGLTSTLSSGGSTTYICSTDVYYCVGGSSKGFLIANGDDTCGSTVTIE